jgi:toxin-antitoxin system PIN domain toxin
VIIPDVNVLLYAQIAAHKDHLRLKKWWEQALSGREEVGLASPAVFGFVRIGTNPRVFTPALEVNEALEIVERWVVRPNARVLTPGPRHLEIAFGLLRAAGAAGNLTTDAQLAAYAIENAATVYSGDVDFGRFPGLSWKNPLK